MANEVTYAASGDARVAEILHGDLHTILADYTDLSTLVPVRRDLTGSGSSTIKIPRVDWDNAMASVAEGSSTSNTAITFSSVTGSVARQALQRQVSDLYELTGSLPEAGLMGIAQSFALAAILRKTDMICGLFSTVSSTVGTTTVPMTVDTAFSALFSLQNNSVPMEGAAMVLYPVQYSNFQNSLRGEMGAASYSPETLAALRAQGPGKKVPWNGIDIYVSDSVPTANAGADSNGCLFVPRAFGAVTAKQNVVIGGTVVYPNAEVRVLFSRDDSGALTKEIGDMFYGVFEQEDSLAVGIISAR